MGILLFHFFAPHKQPPEIKSEMTAMWEGGSINNEWIMSEVIILLRKFWENSQSKEIAWFSTLKFQKPPFSNRFLYAQKYSLEKSHAEHTHTHGCVYFRECWVIFDKGSTSTGIRSKQEWTGMGDLNAKNIPSPPIESKFSHTFSLSRFFFLWECVSFHRTTVWMCVV